MRTRPRIAVPLVTRRRLPTTLRAVLALTALGVVGVAVAATITVNTTLDETTTNGKCSLREALDNANNNSAAHADCNAGVANDTIVFDPVVFPPDQLTAITLSGPLDFFEISGDLNPSTIDGGGVVAIDGAGTHQLFVTSSIVKLKGLTLRNGHATGGGAIVNGGSLTVEQCTIIGNSAQNGGAIFNAGGLTIESSTLSGNTTTATGLGGAIYSSAFFFASLHNATISGNAAFKGGALFAASAGGTIDNSTIANNSAQTGVGIYLGNGSGSTTEFIRDTIITGSGGGSTCAFTGLLNPIDDLGGNIEDANSCGFSVGAGSKPITNPLLGPLRANGGPTQTLRPLGGSPAIDATSCQTAADQRGVSRPQGIQCDSGAVESDDLFEAELEPPNTCHVSADCPAGANECSFNFCTAGACSAAFATIGSFCSAGQCDGMGTCLSN